MSLQSADDPAETVLDARMPFESATLVPMAWAGFACLPIHVEDDKIVSVAQTVARILSHPQLLLAAEFAHASTCLKTSNSNHGRRADAANKIIVSSPSILREDENA